MHLAQTSWNNLSHYLWRGILSIVAVCLAWAVWAQQPIPEKTAPATNQKLTTIAPINQNPTQSALPESQQKLADDAARLLKLATELKAEVDKTSKDTLSLKVVRQAESIEKLAKGVRQELKQSTGPS